LMIHYELVSYATDDFECPSTCTVVNLSKDILFYIIIKICNGLVQTIIARTIK